MGIDFLFYACARYQLSVMVGKIAEVNDGRKKSLDLFKWKLGFSIQLLFHRVHNFGRITMC